MVSTLSRAFPYNPLEGFPCRRSLDTLYKPLNCHTCLFLETISAEVSEWVICTVHCIFGQQDISEQQPKGMFTLAIFAVILAVICAAISSTIQIAVDYTGNLKLPQSHA